MKTTPEWRRRNQSGSRKDSYNDCQSIRKNLAKYEKASGQTINRGKFVIIASKNIAHEKLKVIEDWLGVNHVKSFGMYLGLPANNYQDRNQVFKGVKS
ncbi:hypothetical protein Csa_016682 [Cucumis sativus]|uniref:Uncharacterized protein n=1 Tax=Cucumis sativus TaxID=3659 RepID=A0A0A0K5A5_CUCSA|nr:hypothetical protein Csa_016682 [Cucumis sativus]